MRHFHSRQAEGVGDQEQASCTGTNGAIRPGYCFDVIMTKRLLMPFGLRRKMQTRPSSQMALTSCT